MPEQHIAHRRPAWLKGMAVAALCVAGLTGGIGWVLLSAQHRYAARPIVPGRVLAARIIQEGVPSYTQGVGGRLHTNWLLQVRYVYSIAGRAYTGDRSPSNKQVMASAEGTGAAGPPAWMREMLAGYAPGKAVTVHYRAEDPTDSVISYDTVLAKRFLLAAAVALVLAALFAAAARLRKST